MESRNTTKEQGLYSVVEMAEILGKSPKTVGNALYVKGFRRVKSIDRVAYFSRAHLEALSVRPNNANKAPARPKPAEVYYIYQSKINIQ